MGNKLSASPFPSYEAARNQFSAAEIAEIKSKFTLISGGQETINLAGLVQRASSSSAYCQRQICPRIFNVIDTKKDGVIDFEEYLCAVAVFRSNVVDEKAKCVFLMYEGIKSGGSMSKDNFRQMVVESGLCIQKSDVPLATLEQWLGDMKPLAQAAAEAAFVQFAAHNNKMELQEFVTFAKSESTIRSFFPFITALLDG